MARECHRLDDGVMNGVEAVERRFLAKRFNRATRSDYSVTSVVTFINMQKSSQIL